MSSNGARNTDANAEAQANPRVRHLRRVSANEFAAVAARSAGETGQSSDALLAFITGSPMRNEQAWFHTPEWQANEAEADADLAAGRVKVYDSDESFLAALDEGASEDSDWDGNR